MIMIQAAKDWLLWHSDELRVCGMLLFVATAFAFATFYTPLFIGILLTSLLLGWACQLFGYVLGYIQRKTVMPEAAAEPKIDRLDGRDDPEAEASLLRAMDRLSDADRQLIEDESINVEIVHDDMPWMNGVQPHGTYIVISDGIQVVRKAIIVYSAAMRARQHGLSIDTPEAFDDWTYRIILHELGHAKGRTDDEMAKTDKY